MIAILQHAEVIRFAAMATFLTLALLLGRFVTRLAPARRTRSSPGAAVCETYKQAISKRGGAARGFRAGHQTGVRAASRREAG